MIRRAIIGIFVCLIAAGLSETSLEARADDLDTVSWVSKIVSLQGRVLIKRQNEIDWRPAGLEDTLQVGDQIRVGANSRAGIVLSNDAVLRLDQNTTLMFGEIEHEETFIFKLLKGAASFFSHRPRSLKIFTPFVNGVVEGTEFYVQVDTARARIDLFEGRILAENEFGTLRMERGLSAIAADGQAPQGSVMVHPRDSVQWALYYPPILAVQPDQGPIPYRESLSLYDQGRPDEALEQLERIAQNGRDARFYTYRAGLLLNVGRAAQAREDIQRALAKDDKDSDALALLAVIAVTQNQKETALAAAQAAVHSNPRSAAAQIALSYAYQAEFNLTQALASARAAASAEPEYGMAWARLAELRLSVGQLEAGVQAAQKAADLNPHLAHAHTILGFAHLTRIEADKAKAAFGQAIALDSAAPLPRLGMGLATIRDGDLEKGRGQIEIAAALDPGNALIRSYLGKAYFDEKRGPLDGRQLEIAKSLDPKDPTAWFYDAIRKQTLNRPVEALHDLEKSIELNDNRAVYRSRLLLDEDLAARSAALGRIYIDLSFQEKALREGAKSLRSDPTDFSAHRLLADIYATRPRHEIDRVSELLQSQLLQPLNISPVQPQLAESTLVVSDGAGPRSSTLSEYNPLFIRDRTTFQLGGASGNNNSWSDEIAISGLYKQYSYSLGQYHYETEGFRLNNALEKDIFNVFVQTALSRNTNIQLEYRQKEVSHGDLELRFDPDDFSLNKQITRDEKIPRIGIHYTADMRHQFLASLILNHSKYTLYEQQEAGPGPFGPIVGTEDRYEKHQAYNAEGQYLYRGKSLNLIVGAGNYEQDISETVSTSVSSGPVVFANNPDQHQDLEIWHANAYTYAFLKPLPKLDVTIGLSADAFEREEVDERQLNPKFGFNYALLPALSIRGAVFRSLKRSLVSNQTIEPTHVVGFSQFFDDLTATDAKRLGLGLDVKATSDLFIGMEMTFNDLDHPVIDGSTGLYRDEKHDELHHRFYLYWLVSPQVSVSTEYRFDDYKRDPLPVDITRAHKLRTQSLPVILAYFHPSGLFAKIKGTYIKQRLEKFATSNGPPEVDGDDFTLVDLNVGYRLMNRYGIIAFSVTNLFDTDFRYQDTNFLTASEHEPVVRPERQYLLKCSINF